MKVRYRPLLAALLACGLITAACSSGDSEPVAQAKTAPGEIAAAPAAPGQDPVAVHQTIRKLWEDHVTWTRLYIVSAVAGLPDADAAAGRLLQNQADIGNAIKPFYGEEAGAKLTELLRGHILTAADLVGAAKAGDEAKVTKAKADWYVNGDEIATFLAGANPNWPADTLKSMMRGHLDQTLAEATARLQGNWAQDISEYGHIVEHIIQMSDALAGGIAAQFPEKFGSPSVPAAELAFRDAMRRLWEDHVQWTRLYIVSAVAGLPDADAAAGRLLKNQDDIGNAVKPYYGEEAGATLTELLRGHILTAADLVGAAKAGDQAKVTKAKADWYANGDEIATFLAGANPAWPLDTLKSMMRGHLDQTLAEATARLQANWAQDISEYEHIHSHILEMSDALAAGIITQFPAKFAY